MGFLGVIGLFEFGEGLVFEVVSPYLLAVGLSFAKNDFRGAFDNPVLSFFVELSLFLRLKVDAMANFIIGLHQ